MGDKGNGISGAAAQENTVILDCKGREDRRRRRLPPDQLRTESRIY